MISNLSKKHKENTFQFLDVGSMQGDLIRSNKEGAKLNLLHMWAFYLYFSNFHWLHLLGLQCTINYICKQELRIVLNGVEDKLRKTHILVSQILCYF